jgi:hypothetical protein
MSRMRGATGGLAARCWSYVHFEPLNRRNCVYSGMLGLKAFWGRESGSVLMRQLRVVACFWKLPRVLAFAGIIACTFGQQAAAQGQGTSCLLSPAKLSDNAVKAFRDQPSELLSLHANGGPVMSRNVRRLAGSDIATVSQLIELAKKADLVQVVAIGVGLAEAAAICKLTDPKLAEEIADQVAKAGIPALASAFAVGVTTLEVAEAGGAGAAGATLMDGKPASGGGSSEPTKVAAGGPIVSDSGNGQPLLLFGSAGVSKTINGSVSPSR